MDTAPEPFLLLEPERGTTVGGGAVNLADGGASSLAGSPALVGAGILRFGFPVLWGLWLVSALFDRWGALGWAAL